MKTNTVSFVIRQVIRQVDTVVFLRGDYDMGRYTHEHFFFLYAGNALRTIPSVGRQRAWVGLPEDLATY